MSDSKSQPLPGQRGRDQLVSRFRQLSLNPYRRRRPSFKFVCRFHQLSLNTDEMPKVDVITRPLKNQLRLRRRPRCGSKDEHRHDPLTAAEKDLQEQLKKYFKANPPKPYPKKKTTPRFEISDDFVNVSDSLSPACPVMDFLRRSHGLSLKRDWLAACLSQLQASLPDFESLDVVQKAKLCFDCFLFADMNSCGAGVLPSKVTSMRDCTLVLRGSYVLQVDKAEEINGCFLLSMTDGVQRVIGLVALPIKSLKDCCPYGLKVSISNVDSLDGNLLLSPENTTILGGSAQKPLIDKDPLLIAKSTLQESCQIAALYLRRFYLNCRRLIIAAVNTAVI